MRTSKYQWLTVKIFIPMTMGLLVNCSLADLGWVPVYVSLILIGPVATGAIVFSGRSLG